MSSISVEKSGEKKMKIRFHGFFYCVIKFEINPVFVSPRIFHFLIVSDRRENFSQSESAIGLSPPTEKAHHLLQAWHRRGRTPILPLAQGRVRGLGTRAHPKTLGHSSCALKSRARRSNLFWSIYRHSISNPDIFVEF